LVGATFPVVGVLVASGWGFDIQQSHTSQPILFLVDTAPLVLGALGYVIGRVYGRLLETRAAIEDTVERRTADLADALSELQHAQGQLLQAQKLEAIGALAAGVAHEINTPIQYVGDNARFLVEAFEELAVFHGAATELAGHARRSGLFADEIEAFDEAVEEVDLEFLQEELPAAAHQAVEGVGRVAEIVRALKDFSHPGSGVKEPVDVNKAVRDTLTVSRNEWKYCANLETLLADELPMVKGHAGPLNQALLIVLVNAAQAIEEKLGSGEKGSILIGTYLDSDAVVVSIADDAGGIPEEIQARVFEPFFTTKEVGKGSGQGLAIARSILVEQHGGDITFEVRPGIGTTFFLRIPTGEAQLD
jgi:signal transduction histidine kinase